MLQKTLRSIAAVLAKSGTTANQVTALALFLSILYGLLLFMYPDVKDLWACLPLFYCLRATLNVLDGILAKEFNLKSRLGVLLNEGAEVAADAALYLPFVFLEIGALLPGVIFLLLSMLSELVGVLALQIGSPRRYDGPLNKCVRAFIFGAIGLAIGFKLKPEFYFTELFSVLCLLSVATIIMRGRRALKTASA